MSELTLIVSTMDGQLDINNYPDGDYKIVIVNQGKKLTLQKQLLKSKSIEVINSAELGLSKSRNLGIDNCKTKFGYITDNDVKFFPGFEKKVVSFFKSTNADVSLFRVKLSNGDSLRKYPDCEMKLNAFSIMKACSIEIAFKNSSKLPKFDKRFGLGAETPIGEENIFLKRCLENRMRIMLSKEYTCCHPEIHTGLTFNRDVLNYRKLVFESVYGKAKCKPIWFAYLLKNRRRFDLNVMEYLGMFK
ncbi:glycosyltransferase [Aeromonas caviae]